MSAAVNKVLPTSGLALSRAMRQVLCCSDWVSIGMVAEGSGTSLADIGLGGTVHNEYEAFVGATVNSPTWVVPPSGDVQYGPYLTIALSGHKHIAAHTATKDLVFPRGLYFEAVKIITSSANRILWHSGTDRAGSDAGHCSAVFDASGNLVVRLRPAGENVDITVPAALCTVGWHTVAFAWDGQDTVLYWDDVANAFRPTTHVPGGWKIASGNTLRLGADHSGAVAGGLSSVSAYGLCCRVPPLLGIQFLLHDPWILGRVQPARTDIARCGLDVDLAPDGTGVRLICNTGLGIDGALSNANIGFRYRSATSWNDLYAAEQIVVSVTGTGDVHQRLEAEVALTAGETRYFAVEYTLDGTNFVPFPIPFCRARGALEVVSFSADEHKTLAALVSTTGAELSGAHIVEFWDEIMVRDILSRATLPDLHVFNGDEVIFVSSLTEDDYGDWLADGLAFNRFMHFADLYQVLTSWVPRKFAAGNHEWTDLRVFWASLSGTPGAKWKQAGLLRLLWMSNGADTHTLTPWPTLTNSPDYLPGRDEFDAGDPAMSYDSWFRSIYLVPGGLDGDTADGTFEDVVIIDMGADHDLQVNDVCDVVVNQGASPTQVREGMTVTAVDVNKVTLEGGTGDLFYAYQGGPLEARVHRTTDYAHTLVADGLQCCWRVKIGTNQVVSADGRLHADVSGEVVGTSHTPAHVDVFRWGPQAVQVLAWVDENPTGHNVFAAHTPVLGADAPGYYARSAGGNWRDGSDESITLTDALAARSVVNVGGHDHTHSADTTHGSIQLRCGQPQAGTVSGYNFGLDSYGDTRVWGVGGPADWSGRFGGWMEVTFSMPIVSLWRQTGVTLTRPGTPFERYPDFTADCWAFGRNAYPSDPDVNTITLDERPTLLLAVVQAAVVEAEGDDWYTVIDETNDVLDIGDEVLDTDTGATVATEDITDDEAYVVALPRTLFTEVLRSSVGELDCGWEQKDDIHNDMQI